MVLFFNICIITQITRATPAVGQTILGINFSLCEAMNTLSQDICHYTTEEKDGKDGMVLFFNICIITQITRATPAVGQTCFIICITHLLT